MRHALVRSSWCLAVAIALLLPAAYAVAGKGGGIPLDADLDALSAGNRLGNDGAMAYDDGTNCLDSDPTACLRVRFISNAKTFALDTRTTKPLRKVRVDFADCISSCAAGDIDGIAGTIVTTPALLEVFVSVPFTSMGDTTEQAGSARLWFTAPDGVNWRVDWTRVFVRRGVGDVWDISAAPPADPEDPTSPNTQEAGLSKLSGKRTKPGDIGNSGKFNIPFSIGIHCQKDPC